MKILYLCIVCFLASINANAQSRPAVIDSLKRLNASKTGDEKSKVLVQLSYQLVQRNVDSALLVLNEAIEVAKTSEMKGRIYLEKSQLYWFLAKDNERGLALDSAYNMLVGVNDSITANALYNKHILLADRAAYKEALKVGYQELAIRKKLPSKDKELNALLQIGYTYDRMGQYKKAIEWYQKGFAIKGVTNPDIIGRNYGLIGIAYDELKNYDKAVEYNLKAITYFKQIPDSKFLHSWYSNLGNTYTKQGKFDLAEKYTLLALEDTGRKRYSTIINLGKIYLEKGNIKKAEKVLNDIVADLLKVDQKIYLSEAYFRLHELYKKTGNYQKALAFFEQYKTYEDERLSLEKTKQFNELTVQYETAEKENKILLQNAKITENEQHLNNRKQWIIGLSLLIIIAGLIGYLLYKQQELKNTKQLKESELELALAKIDSQKKLQEQRLSISRDLHDNIGAQLSFIISAIDTIKFYFYGKDDIVITKLSHIGDFAKETIQELRDTVWAMNKSAITLNDLQNRIVNFIEKAKQSQPLVNLGLVINGNMENNKNFTAIQGLNIYRIIQEATHNALKYAQATEIKIHINTEKEIYFEVADNGKGFVEQEVELGNGLLNMRKRATELGSSLILNSTIGVGTNINFRVVVL